MQSVSSRIWTRVAVFISYDHYTTGTYLTIQFIQQTYSINLIFLNLKRSQISAISNWLFYSFLMEIVNNGW